MLLTERYLDKISGVISCFDRVVIQGTLPEWCYNMGMTAYLYAHQIKIFDYPTFANNLRLELLRVNSLFDGLQFTIIDGESSQLTPIFDFDSQWRGLPLVQSARRFCSVSKENVGGPCGCGSPVIPLGWPDYRAKSINHAISGLFWVSQPAVLIEFFVITLFEGENSSIPRLS